MKTIYKLALQKREELIDKIKNNKNKISLNIYENELEFYDLIISSFKKHQQIKEKNNTK